MALKAVLEKLDDVDEALRGEYKEVEDPVSKAKFFVLDILEVAKLPDVSRLTTSLAKERTDHKATKDKFKPYAAFGEPAELQARLDRVAELEVLAEGKLDEPKIKALVDARVKTEITPVARERDTFKARVTELEGTVAGFTKAEQQRKITGALLRDAKSLKVVDSAMDDVELYGERMFELTEGGDVVTKDGVGVTPGLTPKQWLEDMQAKRPHWWGTTSGGGAGGNNRPGAAGGENPWGHATWNDTKQGEILRAKGKPEADRLARLAGTTVGGPKPKPPAK